MSEMYNSHVLARDTAEKDGQRAENSGTRILLACAGRMLNQPPGAAFVAFFAPKAVH